MRWGGRRSLFAELSWYFAYICVLQSSIAMAWWVCRQGNRRDDSQRLWGHVGSSPGMPVTATCHCGDARATAIGEGFGSALSKWTHAFGQASQYRCNSLFMWCLCEKYFFFLLLSGVFLQQNTEAWKGNQTQDVPTSATSTPSAAPASDSEEALPSGWGSTVCSTTGQPYYWNLSDPNNTATWERPK